MTIIIPANTLADAAFSVDNSCRFNDGDSPRLHKTLGTPTNVDKWTFSAWIKRGVLGINCCIFEGFNDDNNKTRIRIINNDKLFFGNRIAGSFEGLVTTNRVLRDPSAWYHIVGIWDSDNASAGSRMRLFVNGVEETSFTDETQLNLAEVAKVGSGHVFNVGCSGTPDEFFDGYLAEVCFIDGQALTPTSFGEFDEDSPTIWKPIDVSGLTFGTNGFYLDFEDSSNLGNDANGGTDFTEVNLAATDSSTDTPTNNFCTLNSVELSTSATIAEGNTELRTTNNGYFGCYATMGFKYGFAAYWEVKIKTANRVAIGLSRKSADEARGDVITGEETEAGSTAFDYMWQPANANNVRYKGTSQSVTIAACSDDDICAFSVSSSGVVKIYLNDSLVHTYSTALQTSEESDRVDTWYFPVFACNAYATSPNYMHVNFGNPTYANTSSNADPDDYGAFEYATKSGYALCTKNLGAYGG